MERKIGLILAVLMLVALASPLLSVTPAQAQPVEPGDWGDAPEGAIAYPDSGTMGQFPTCIAAGPATWVYHGPGPGPVPLAWFGVTGDPFTGLDWETDGNAGSCTFPPYDQDEGEFGITDLDAGLLGPHAYTVSGGSVVAFGAGGALGYTCQPAAWGVNSDILTWNLGPDPAYVNVLMDWNQDGMWGGNSTCPGGNMTPEHVLVNLWIPAGSVGILADFGAPDFLIGPNAGYIWTRFTISPEPVGEDWDGSGDFSYGETEDYLLLIEGAADLSVSKTADPEPVLVDEDLTYNVTVINHGPSDATGVSVTDLLAAGMTYKSDSPSQGSYDSGTGVWTVGNLTNGSSANLTLVATVGAIPGLTNNYARVSGSEYDPDTSNNSDIVYTTILAGVDLEITKSDDPDPVIAGEDLTYNVTVTNHGPHDATGVYVIELRASGVTYKSGTPSQGTYNISTGIWDIGNMGSGNSTTLILVVTVNSYTTGTISNQVHA